MPVFVELKAVFSEKVLAIPYPSKVRFLKYLLRNTPPNSPLLVIINPNL